MSDAFDSRACELRVLQGPQAGSRLALSHGDYGLGSGDDCAVVLTGPGVRAMHAVLTVGFDGLRLRPEEGEVTDAMGRRLGDDTALSLGVPLELGGVWISIDHVDTPWPDARALGAGWKALVEAADSMVEPTLEAMASGEVGDAGNGDLGGKDGDDDEDGIDAPLAPAAPRKSRRRWARSASIALGIAVVASSAYGLAAWFEPAGVLGRHLGKANVHPVVAASAPRLAMASASAASDVAFAASAAMAASSASAPSAASAALAASAGAAASAPEIERSDAQILADAQDYLAQHADAFPGTALHVEAGESPGTLHLSGAARDSHLVDEATAKLQASVPGLHKIQTDVKGPAQLVDDFKSLVHAAGLTTKVTVIQETPVLLIEGDIATADRARWDSLLNNFLAGDDRVMPFWAWIKHAAPVAAPGLPFAIKTIVGGPMPYIITAEGERATPGARIGGRKLTDINDSEVVFDGTTGTHVTR